MASKKTALVISAHSADFVWRCGGAIALHEERGYDVTVVCLSYGERGESAKLWKQEGMTLEKVKTERRKEAENAAAALGASDIRFFDLGDYPLTLDRDAKDRMVDVIREVQPSFMLSHSKWDPYNTDHMATTQFAIECRMIAQAWGHNPGQKVLGAPQLYLFEPHQTEQMGWKPDTFLDVECKLIQCSTHWALFRKEDGHCVKGPCVGKTLTAFPITIDDDGMVLFGE